MGRSVHIEGGRAVEQALLELGRKEALRIGRSALRQTARPILLAARAGVPVNEGRLRRALELKIDRGRNDKRQLFATIKVKRGPNYRPRKTDNLTTRHGKKGRHGGGYQVGSTPEVYGAFLEFGAPARGIAPRGFMRRAWHAEGGYAALGKIGRLIGDGIVHAAERMKLGKR